MQTMSDNEFDQLFRDQLGEMEIEPSDRVWSKISAELGHSPKRKSVISPIWMAAASVVVVVTVGSLLLRPSETIKLRKEEPKYITKTEVARLPEQQREPLPGSTTKKGSLAEKLSSLKDGTQKAAKSVDLIKADKKPRKAEEVLVVAAVDEMVAEVPETGQDGQRQAVSIAPVSARLNIPTADSNSGTITSEQVHFATAIQAEEPEKGRGNIKTVGDLVNFVIGKVDKRKEKLIEFSENDEGTLISGINLGLVKIRTKNSDRNN